MHDVKQIKQTYNIEDIISRTIPLKRQGSELVGNCPFHDDRHASMKVSPSKQIFCCFVCDAKGDMFDFFKHHGKTIPEACNYIVNNSIVEPNAVPRKTEKKIEWVSVVPNQNSLPDMRNVNFRDYGAPSAYWPYHDKFGNVIGYACRFNLPDGKKDVLPYTYKSNGERTCMVV